MKCPNCRNQFNYAMDKDPDGNTKCLICEMVAPTVEWRKRVKSKREKDLEAENAELRKLVEQIADNLEKHRAESMICCDEKCFCWDIAELLEKAERGE